MDSFKELPGGAPSPAQEQGQVRPGDFIVMVDGQSTEGEDYVRRGRRVAQIMMTTLT
eukprot:COSAG01_NODE_6441_length_3663_cov_2.253367_3_plen_57_part_00